MPDCKIPSWGWDIGISISYLLMTTDGTCSGAVFLIVVQKWCWLVWSKKSNWEYQKSHGKSIRGWKVKCNSACFQLASHCVGCCEKSSRKDGVWDETEHCMCSTHKSCHTCSMLQTGAQIGNSWPYGYQTFGIRLAKTNAPKISS